MHLYWKVFSELEFLGECVVLRDPGLKRCYEQWMGKKAAVLGMAAERGLVPEKPVFPVSLN
jgi:hypothetical protein